MSFGFQSTFSVNNYDNKKTENNNHEVLNMDTYFDAVILAIQNPAVCDDWVDILTPQLFRTSKYCCDKDLVILRTFLMQDHCDDKVFYDMVNFINYRNRSVAVVLNGVPELQLLDFNNIVLLDLLLNLATIEIHLVEENVSIIDITNQDELKLWSEYTHTNPEQMKWLRDGMYINRDLQLNLDRGVHVNRL